jgi:hypothetical protein
MIDRQSKARGVRVQLVAAWFASVCVIWILAAIIGATGHVHHGSVPFPRSAVDVLASWDGLNYRQIAEDGYSVGRPHLFAFFPAMPLLSRLLGDGYAPLAGIILSQLSFLGCMLLLAEDAPKGSGLLRQPGFWLLVSPVGFFLLAFYTESLFLLSVLVVVAACRRGRYFTGAIGGFVAGLTRPTSLVVPLLTIGKARRSNLTQLALPTIAPLLGAGLYVAFVGYVTHDPLGYIHVQQKAFGGYGSGQLSWPFSADVGEVRLLFSYLPRRHFPPLDIPVSLASTAMIIVVLAAWWKHLDLSQRLYSVGGLIFIHTATSGSSSARYELMLFPAFIGIAGILSRRPRFAVVAAATSYALQLALFHKFAMWEFVA